MKKNNSYRTYFLIILKSIFALEAWDILDKSMVSWKTNGGIL